MNQIIRLILICLFLLPASSIQTAYAQGSTFEKKKQKKDTNEEESENEEEKKLKEAVSKIGSDNYATELKRNPPKRIRQHIYESPSLKSFVYLHWSLDMIDLENDENIDFFLKVIECDIYKKFKSDEFEWEKIRESTREYIRENKYDFPVRYEIVIPLTLQDYNKEKSFFELHSDAQIRSARLFEFTYPNTGYLTTACIESDSAKELGNYNNQFAVELSRPFSLNTLPASEDIAKEIIKNANDAYKKHIKEYGGRDFDQAKMFSFRRAYLFVYINLLTYKGIYQIGAAYNSTRYSQVLGVVEGYEVFEDVNRKKLIYSRNYITRRDPLKESKNLTAELSILKERISSRGMFYDKKKL